MPHSLGLYLKHVGFPPMHKNLKVREHAMVKESKWTWVLGLLLVACLCAAPASALTRGEVEVISKLDRDVYLALAFQRPGQDKWEVQSCRMIVRWGKVGMLADDQGQKRAWRLYVLGYSVAPGTKLTLKDGYLNAAITPPCQKTLKLKDYTIIIID